MMFLDPLSPHQLKKKKPSKIPGFLTELSGSAHECIHSMCMRICADTPEHVLLADGISANISCTYYF